MGRKVSGEATMGELRELEELMQKDPDMRYKLSVLSNWPPAGNDNAWEQKTESALEKHLLRMEAEFPMEELPVKRTGRNIRKLTAILSVLVLMLGSYCVYLLMRNTPLMGNKASVAAIFTRDGSRSRAQLPDGTEVWLNGGSRLTYHPDMNNLDSREVTLEGEAFFDVAKNAAKPFSIHTTKMNIQVLGTSFNVKAYTQDETTEATLITGAVEVTLNDGVERTIRLLPNQKIVLQHNNEFASSKPAGQVDGYRVENIRYNQQDSLVAETAWYNNYLVFDNDSFEDIARKMERWYGIKIHLNGEKLKQYRFTATFKNESFPEVLEALKVTTSFRFRITGNEIFITQ
ncbi:FecR family protein [Chitinophaga eiseniae]|uniref:FecR family protein n=1 Tax=Chitinophaga eiseniae TaxID=634771 RepID=A0A847SNP2_9BACT|nr:FecR family protein [Chitinophaga eiseniae]NLR77602.1 FecR family protein [Chitinophaga eiseniae]